MRKNIKYLLIVISLSIISCDQDDTEKIEKNAKKVETSIELQSSYRLLDYTPNIYHDFFKKSDYNAGFSSLKSNSFEQPSVVQRMNMENDYISRISTKVGKTEKELSRNDKQVDEGSLNIYGEKVSFIIGKYSNSTKEETTETEVELYMPEMVEITNPKVLSKDEMLPICYFEDFILEWNADPNNKEGLVVIAEYFGDNAIPGNTTENHVLNTDYIEMDNGKALLNNKIFEGIPNLGIVHLILLRGNVSTEEIEGELYKFYAETHARLGFILLRDKNTITKG